MKKKIINATAITGLAFALLFQASAQQLNRHEAVTANTNYISKVWSPDLGNGSYKNPVLNADYSDPDAVRVGDDFYMVASSFEDVPGLPILHSKDLVNWRLIGHGLSSLVPDQHFMKPRHGEGVWAPAIRYHKDSFYIYYPDPDFGIYVIKAKDPAGPWTQPVLIMGGRGLIDPCPLWDEDGKAYLVHAFAGSRAGIKSVIAVNKMNSEGTKVLDPGVIVYDGHKDDPTIEGPKFYKRSGYYYIFAPAGGVSTGWQLVLRSKNIYGPYERKVVMDQGKSTINGPHQGAWITTPKGADWFLHFQDKGVYGRVVHLQPMAWKDNWPIIGVDKDGDGIGTPVTTYKKPDVGRSYPVDNPAESDEFNSAGLGLQWQWMANPGRAWYYMNPAQGVLRLYSTLQDTAAGNLWFAPNALLQKFPADQFMVTTKLEFYPNAKLINESAGLTVMGFSYAALGIKKFKDGNYLTYWVNENAAKGGETTEKQLVELKGPTVYLRVKVDNGGICTFSYSLDGNQFTAIKTSFQATVGQWIGAKVGLYCSRQDQINDAGYADIDWFRVTPFE
ncbi:MAG TPA: glycoside hydrolase 43 family protein [Arachidicoccus sp.]|nr:glycoside hydrolase 43 family protein [Arachidicoccus sp.]